MTAARRGGVFRTYDEATVSTLGEPRLTEIIYPNVNSRNSLFLHSAQRERSTRNNGRKMTSTYLYFCTMARLTLDD